MNLSFFGGLLHGIAKRGLALTGQSRDADAARQDGLDDLLALCDTLLSLRGEASGTAMADQILAAWQALEPDQRRAFLIALAERFGPDQGRLDAAVRAYKDRPGDLAAMTELHEAAEPRRQELIRRINLAPGATEALVLMREDVLRHKKSSPALRALDADFFHLFSSWFNRGFLMLHRIDWATPASILEKIIQYEAIHAINDWDELRRRLQPPDRRCFGFFHPQLVGDPLIFVEVALTDEIPDNVAAVLDPDRTPKPAAEATTAVFYSLSKCQDGLAGVSFGNFLIKQVVEDLQRELPKLDTFVTLSPVPGFASWLDGERTDDTSAVLSAEDKAALAALDAAGWHEDPAARDAVRGPLLAAAAHYFLKGRDPAGRHINAVARFHLGNGARLERLNFLGDPSPNGLRQSYGLMVNYLYKLEDIEQNHELFLSKGEVVTTAEVRRLADSDDQPFSLKAIRQRF
jgi:malonyl-CoA decarboxylase